MARPAKKKTMSRRGAKLAGDKFMGAEPELPMIYSQSDLILALNWYNYMYDHTEGMNWIIEWAENAGYTPKAIDTLKKIEPRLFSFTTMSLSRLDMNTPALEERLRIKIKTQIDDLISKTTESKNVTVVKMTPSVQSKMQERTNNIIADFDFAIDNRNFDIDPQSLLKSQSIKPVQANKIISYYSRIIDEYKNAGVLSHMTKIEAKKMVAFIEKIVEAAKSLQVSVKVTRSPRKRKIRSPTQLVSKFNYAKENADYKVTSIDPLEIIGAYTLWVFNPRYKHITFYVSDTGFMVKGTTIIGYDPDRSFRLRVRKPADACKLILTSTKLQLDRMSKTKSLNTLKATIVPMFTGRTTEDAILLRVDK